MRKVLAPFYKRCLGLGGVPAATALAWGCSRPELPHADAALRLRGSCSAHQGDKGNQREP